MKFEHKSSLTIEELKELINNATVQLNEKEEEEKKKSENTVKVWINEELIKTPNASTIEIIKAVNSRAYNSNTSPKTDVKKCIEDCNSCKYLNHKNKTQRSCPKYGNISIRRAIMVNGHNVKTTVQAHLSEGLKELNDRVLSGAFMKDIELSSNDKLEGIPTLNMPNIFLQVQFMQFVELNKEFLELPVVSLLYTYFKEFAMCKNCQYCNGLCYNNKLLVQYKGKCISELRALLAYILRREELKELISNNIGNNRLFRIHGNGEFHSLDNLKFWLDIVKQNKDVKFYTYTKSYDLIHEFLLQGGKLPTNFILNISMVEGQQNDIFTKYPLLEQFNKFVIILDKELKKDKKALLCGNACLKCDKGCHSKGRNGKTIYVVAH